MNPAKMTDALRDKEAALLNLLRGCGRSLLAYSGGVDSGYLAVLCAQSLNGSFLPPC